LKATRAARRGGAVPSGVKIRVPFTARQGPWVSQTPSAFPAKNNPNNIV